MTNVVKALFKKSEPASEPAPIEVLIVDDEAPVRAYVERVLRRAGYQTSVAENAGAALAFVAAGGPFDILVTDLNMPDLNGEELARRLRLAKPDLPVLYLTGYSEHLFTERSLLAEREAFLDKPCTPKALLDAVALVSTTTYVGDQITPAVDASLSED